MQKQLELANERETGLISEKSKLLKLLSEEKRARMPPPDEHKSRGWFQRLIGCPNERHQTFRQRRDPTCFILF